MTIFVYEKIVWTYNPDSSRDTVDPVVVTWNGKDARMHTDADDLNRGDRSVDPSGNSDVPAPTRSLRDLARPARVDSLPGREPAPRIHAQAPRDLRQHGGKRVPIDAIGRHHRLHDLVGKNLVDRGLPFNAERLFHSRNPPGSSYYDAGACDLTSQIESRAAIRPHLTRRLMMAHAAGVASAGSTGLALRPRAASQRQIT
jgi:hypothetical protein